MNAVPYRRLFLMLLLLILLVACGVQKSAYPDLQSNDIDSDDTTASANETDSITIDTRRTQIPRKSSNIEEYKEHLSTVTSIETLAAYLEIPVNDVKKENFDMLFEEGFFLVPILPENCTLLYAAVLADGTSSFSIRLYNQYEIEVVCHHDKQAEYWFTYAASFAGKFKNARDIAISHYIFTATDSGYYAWKEGSYKCIVDTVISPEEQAICEAFLKELAFEKVYIDQPDDTTGSTTTSKTQSLS